MGRRRRRAQSTSFRCGKRLIESTTEDGAGENGGSEARAEHSCARIDNGMAPLFWRPKLGSTGPRFTKCYTS